MAKNPKTTKTTHKGKPGTRSFTGEFYQMFKEDLAPKPLQVLPKIKEEGTLPNSYHEIRYLVPTPEKDSTKKTIGKYLTTI